MLEAVWRHPRVAIRSANSMGKNFAIADFMAWWMATGRRVKYMAPTDRQLDIGMRELARAIRKSGLPFERYHRRIRVNGEDRLNAMTSNSADSLRGDHDPAGLLVVIDEGQGAAVEAVAYDAAFSCATGEGDRIAVLGNPSNVGGRFHAICESANWVSLKIVAREHPNIATGKVVIPGGPAPNWPETIAKEYGIDSPFYRAFVDAEFPSQAEDALVQREWLEAAVARWIPVDVLPQWAPARAESVFVGVDPARLGPDRTVCCVRREMQVDEFIEWRGQDTMQTSGRVVREVRKLVDARRRVISVHVDEIGIGSGVLDRLKETLPTVKYWDRVGRSDATSRAVKAVGFDAGKRAFLPDRFTNLRSQGYWHLRKLLEENKLALPDNSALFEELLATRVIFGSDGRTAIESKDDIKKRLGRSPDLADALVISLAPALRGRARVQWI